MCNRNFHMHIEIDIVDTNQVFKVARNLIQVWQFRWMLPQRDLWIGPEHGGVQMDALQRDLWMHVNTPLGSDGCSTEGLVDACKHPENMIERDTKAGGLAEEPE